MEKVKLTDRRIADALEASKRIGLDREQYWTDRDVKGFQVRLTKTGKALAYLQYWRGGKGGRSVKLALGEIGDPKHGKLSIVEARRKASAARGIVDAGGDPWADEKLRRDRLKAETFADAWNLFTADWSDEDRYRKETKALVENDALPALGSRPLAIISRREIAETIDKVKARSQARGRALSAALRPCFKWCVERELLEHSPMEGLRPVKPVQARDRYLTEKELAAFWRASGEMVFPWLSVYRLLALTGVRREEAAAFEWRELDGDVWTIPGAKTKNGMPHIIDLPPLAVEILNAVPKIKDADGELQQRAFSTTGSKPPSGFSKAKNELDALMRADIGKFTPFRLHDLRRTLVTTLTESFEYDEELGDRILNHKKKGITKVYNIATRRKERKEALLKWSEYVLRIASKTV